jgi:hypothetical protein
MKSMPLVEQQRVAKDAPGFVRIVRRAQKERLTKDCDIVIIITLDAFYDDAVLLYLCLWYASTEGVTVTLAPTSVAMKDATT